MGVGVQGFTLKQLTTHKLASALKELTTNEDIIKKAAKIGEEIRAQDGIPRAVDFFHRQMRKVPKKGEWLLL